MKLLFPSLRWSLLIWHSLMMAGLIAALWILATQLTKRDRTDRLEGILRNTERGFHQVLFARDMRKPGARPPGGNEIRAKLANLPTRTEFPPNLQPLFERDGGVYLAVWDTNGKPLYRSENAPQDLPFPKAHDGPQRNRERGHFFERVRGNYSGIVSLAGIDATAEHAASARFHLMLGLAGIAIIAIAAYGGWWIINRALEPIDNIGKTASRIAAGDLHERIETTNSDNELTRLARVLNGTFDRLAAIIHRQKQFTADASHELRTPLTVILAETQRGLKREREPETYREILANCRSAAERMRALSESLLALARQDAAETICKTTALDLADIAAETADLLEPLAVKRALTVQRGFSAAEMSGDAAALGIVAQNLIANAFEHAPEGSTIELLTGKSGAEVFLEVADDGPPIPAAHLPHLFDRFYRADLSRQFSSGPHSGLGLAIARAIVTRHEGKISVETSAGNRFRASFPLQRNPLE